jgi:hypothetical protein
VPENEKLYIAYLTSGLGNRLRPLASAVAYCARTGRTLKVYWDQVTPNGCLTPLEKLFKNAFDPISLEEIEGLGNRSVGLYTEKGPGHGVAREAERFGRPQLKTLAAKSPPYPCSLLGVHDESDVVIVYDNNYLGCLPKEESIGALRSLVPQDDVVERVRVMVDVLGLTPQTKSVHARGTDFGLQSALELYAGLIRNAVDVEHGEKFFLSTDDAALEHGIAATFPGLVLTRGDRLHLQLNEGKANWTEPDSFTISADHGLDALTDIYLLSCTNLVVFHPGSTFGEISRHLHGVLSATLHDPKKETVRINATSPDGQKRVAQLEINLPLLHRVFTKPWIDAIASVYADTLNSLDSTASYNREFFLCSGNNSGRNDASLSTAVSDYFGRLLYAPNIAVLDYVLRNYERLQPLLFVDNGAGLGLLSAFLKRMSVECLNYDNFKQVGKTDFATHLRDRYNMSISPVSDSLDPDRPPKVVASCGIWLDDGAFNQEHLEYLLLDPNYLDRSSFFKVHGHKFSLIAEYPGLLNVYTRIHETR